MAGRNRYPFSVRVDGTFYGSSVLPSDAMIMADSAVDNMFSDTKRAVVVRNDRVIYDTDYGLCGSAIDQYLTGYEWFTIPPALPA